MPDRDATLSFEQRMPSAFKQLCEVGRMAEQYFRDVCEMEFTVQNDHLFVLALRPGKRSQIANLRFALQFLAEGKIGPQDVLRRVSPSDFTTWLVPVIRNGKDLRLVGRGIPACEGVATGRVAFHSDHALEYVARKTPTILARSEVSPEDLQGILRSQGVLTMRGGVSSHAALICRQAGKPCVCAYSPKHAQVEDDGDVRSLFRAGKWITINGLTGEVFEGRAKFKTQSWRDYPELVALAEIVSWAVTSDNVPRDAVGNTWRMSDFFLHAAPLTRGTIGKKSVSRQSYTSFESLTAKSLERVQQSLTPLAPGERRNYGEILLSVMDSQLRILSRALGVGNHPQYFRPLWDPKQSVRRRNEDEETQLVGMEFFGLNRYIPHLVDVATITILLELDVRGEDNEWFLDFTNPAGESLVVGSESVRAYRLLINDVDVEHDDIPQFYNSLRCREYGWRVFEENATTYSEIANELANWIPKQSVNTPSLPLCYELGLIRNRKLTLAGESLLGKLHRKKKYEFTKNK